MGGRNGGFLGVGGRRAVGVAGGVVFGVCGRGWVSRACLLVRWGRGDGGRVCWWWCFNCLVPLVAAGCPVEMVPAVGGWW